MKNDCNLADLCLRESARKRKLLDHSITKKISEARRFLLDDDASSFLADLSHASFSDAEKSNQHIKYLDQVRELARLPHHLCWFEYNGVKYTERSMTAYPWLDFSGGTPDLTKIAPRVGWLLEEQSETLFSMIMILAQHTNAGLRPIAIPFLFCWSTEADVLPWHAWRSDINNSGMATGISAYRSNYVTIAKFENSAVEIDDPEYMLQQVAGELRVVWPLLATINDIPFGIKHVQASHGFYNRAGRFQKFLDHSVISLNLPKGRNPQKIARLAVALSRRRAHQVRGHWRRDWRHAGNKLWIKEHQRGDASLGFVLHSYNVTHEENHP